MPKQPMDDKATKRRFPLWTHLVIESPSVSGRRSEFSSPACCPTKPGLRQQVPVKTV